jgi:chemotaxis protein methyltransferase CheR
MVGEVTATEGAGAAFRTERPGIDLEDIEISLLLEGIRLHYGYDFREYALNPVRRGLMTAMARENAPTVSAYQGRVLHDAACMQRFLALVGVSVTTMFRDPDLMVALRDEVVPLLKTYASTRVWIAGCATGEEVYSFAVLLQEEGLRRSTIYATDLNEDMLAVARAGTYPLDRMRRCEEPYRQSGGRGSLSDHYTVMGRNVRFNPEVQANITWARHNLVTDGSFNDFHLIVCANVLIYFGSSLQGRAHRLFYDSLIRGGFLALGKRESLLYCPDRDHYEQVRDGLSLYRKLRW